MDVAGTGSSLSAAAAGRTNGGSNTFKAAEPPLDLTAAVVPSKANPVEGDTILVTVTVVNATDASGVNLVYTVPIPADA